MNHAIEALGAAGGATGVLLAALLLGLRHATDPDHLTAVSTLVLGDRRTTPRRAGWLGLCWGAGHATTLILIGAPLVLLGVGLPGGMASIAELAIGLLIAGLAVRLLIRSGRGYFHWHPHRHGDVMHSHPHFHEKEARHADDPARDVTAGIEIRESARASADRARDGDVLRARPRSTGGRTRAAGDSMAAGHGHTHPAPRSAAASFMVGLIHGVGGSAGASVLIVAAIPGRAASLFALLLFSFGTAVSMGGSAFAFGWILSRDAVSKTLPRLMPGLATACLAFGIWYAAQAAGLLGR